MRSSTERLAGAAGRHWLLPRRWERDGRPLEEHGITRWQAAEIEAALAGAGPPGPEMALRLKLHLSPLVHRGVPPRAIRPAPVPHVGRLVFADGTTVLVTSPLAGGFELLALAMSRGSVQAAGCSTDTAGRTCLELGLPGRSRALMFYVMGLDQPD